MTVGRCGRISTAEPRQLHVVQMPQGHTRRRLTYTPTCRRLRATWRISLARDTSPYGSRMGLTEGSSVRADETPENGPVSRRANTNQLSESDLLSHAGETVFARGEDTSATSMGCAYATDMRRQRSKPGTSTRSSWTGLSLTSTRRAPVPISTKASSANTSSLWVLRLSTPRWLPRVWRRRMVGLTSTSRDSTPTP
jgi:hypothetical protein